MNVTVLPEAELDLENIGDMISLDAPRRAVSFIRDLRVSALAIEKSPLAYPLLPGYEAEGLRRRVHGQYVIIHKIKCQEIFILRVLHGARDFERILKNSR